MTSCQLVVQLRCELNHKYSLATLILVRGDLLFKIDFSTKILFLKVLVLYRSSVTLGGTLDRIEKKYNQPHYSLISGLHIAYLCKSMVIDYSNWMCLSLLGYCIRKKNKKLIDPKD